ncbi:MFS transporter [Acidovorax lacteus]|uniref:MFS transporter n=1 Tax=Acidovorax lacteus TaxID=1924988 RepID=A0ABP8L4X5_9BURK
MPAPSPIARTTLLLGLAQTLAWASSYYLPAVLAAPMARDLGVAASTVFAAFSVALLVSALVGPWAGRRIDRLGGRPVLMASNAVFALALLALAAAQGPVGLLAAWALMGVAMGSGLYEAAFATAVRLHGTEARRSITGITLFAGFASTVGWPLSTAIELHGGWRATCMTWAGLHLLVALPLNALLATPAAGQGAAAVPTSAQGGAHGSGGGLSAAARRRAAVLMAAVFAVAWFNSTAMAAHLPMVLQASGVALAAAVGMAALVGPAQVAGRLLEFSLLRRAHPLLSARLASLAHPLGALLLLAGGLWAAPAFVVLHGLGNGILTIAIGTLPLWVFGAQGYGQRQGLLMVPARLVQAGAPFLFGLAVARWGSGALVLSASLALLALGALLWMPLAAPGGTAASAAR